MRRSRRGTSRSAFVAVLGLGAVLAPLINNPNNGATPSPLAQLQAGNWAGAAGALANNVQQYWSSYLILVLVVAVTALAIRKIGKGVHLSRHWRL